MSPRDECCISNRYVKRGYGFTHHRLPSWRPGLLAYHGSVGHWPDRVGPRSLAEQLHPAQDYDQLARGVVFHPLGPHRVRHRPYRDDSDAGLAQRTRRTSPVVPLVSGRVLPGSARQLARLGLGLPPAVSRDRGFHTSRFGALERDCRHWSAASAPDREDLWRVAANVAPGFFEFATEVARIEPHCHTCVSAGPAPPDRTRWAS